MSPSVHTVTVTVARGRDKVELRSNPHYRETFMTTREVAHKLVEMCSRGDIKGALESLYSPDIVSMEATAPPGHSRETKGIAGVKRKSEWWEANHEIHSMKVEGPLVADSHFAVTFKMDVTFRPQSKRFEMEEIAIYKVADGKIVYEEFFYSM
jgi:ketosteroid isomerase-like protein